MGEKLRIWAAGCPHIGKDIQFGRESLLKACVDAEKVGFDFAIALGDYSGRQGLPEHEEGVLYRQQIEDGCKNHRPEDFYPVAGNHDRTDKPGAECLDWFREHMDPLDESPETSGNNPLFRPFDLDAGSTIDSYKMTIGNLSLMMLSDVNRPLTPKRGELGGDPAGVVTPETYQKWKDWCDQAQNDDGMAFTFAHYLPKETTTATVEYGGGNHVNGQWEGQYHGAGYTDGLASSYLAFVGETLGRPFIEHMEANPGVCQLWVGAHNHVMSWKKVGGLPHLNNLHGCQFVQNGAITMYHHGGANEKNPKSRFYEVENGSDVLKIYRYFHKTVGQFTKGLGSPTIIQLPKPVRF